MEKCRSKNRKNLRTEQTMVKLNGLWADEKAGGIDAGVGIGGRR